jgi:hypothetical protein
MQHPTGNVVIIVSVILAIAGCGKKAPPPSPDRWAPKLSTVKATNRTHVECLFREDMDPKSTQNPSYYTIITSESGDTLPVLGAVLDGARRKVELATLPQDSVVYRITVDSVQDASGNPIAPGTSREFHGSLEPDRIHPRIRHHHPADKAISVPQDSAIVITFSEAMDTSATISNGGFYLTPLDSVSTNWLPSQGTFEISNWALPIEDTLASPVVYSLVVTRRCQDLSDNPLTSPLCITFTPGDSLPSGLLKGRVTCDGDPSNTLVLLYDLPLDEWHVPMRVYPVSDSLGGYRFHHLYPGTYFVAAVQDTDADGLEDRWGFYGEGDSLLPVMVDTTQIGPIDFSVRPLGYRPWDFDLLPASSSLPHPDRVTGR